MDILLQRAREYQQLYTPQMTLDLYQRAIDICQKNGLYRKQAEVHCALFEVLRTHNLSLAMKEADNAISMCPEYDQVRDIGVHVCTWLLYSIDIMNTYNH